MASRSLGPDRRGPGNRGPGGPGPDRAGERVGENAGRAGRERAADAAVHAVAILAVLAGCVLLAAAMRWPPEGRAAIGAGLYAAGLIATFGFSAVYNTAAPGPRRALLRRFDHAAIFVMIAGTYTPVTLLAIGGRWGLALLGFVWAGAVLGAGVKLLAPGRFERASIAAYLLLGWVGVAALAPLTQALAPWQLGALALGGALYSLGVIVHLWERLPYHTAIWHLLVLAAAGAHYALVLSLVAG